MRGFLTIETLEEFDAWMAAEVAKKAEQGEGGGFWQ